METGEKVVVVYAFLSQFYLEEVESFHAVDEICFLFLGEVDIKGEDLADHMGEIGAIVHIFEFLSFQFDGQFIIEFFELPVSFEYTSHIVGVVCMIATE